MKFGRIHSHVERRKQVLQLYAEGLDINQIAHRLKKTRRMVGNDLIQLRLMNNCTHKGHLVYKALKENVIC